MSTEYRLALIQNQHNLFSQLPRLVIVARLTTFLKINVEYFPVSPNFCQSNDDNKLHFFT